MNSFETLKQRLAQFPGEFEYHITVDIAANQLDAFCADCDRLAGKAIVIELAGIQSIQPMMAKMIDGSIDDPYQQIVSVYQVLESTYKITRVKVEASVGNLGVPQSAVAAKALPDTCYFEHHVRMNLPLDTDLDHLTCSLQGYAAHLSNNAFARSDVYQQRFATQRFRVLGDQGAYQALETLLAYLSGQGIVVDKVIREFNIYDSNKDMDAGWEYGR